MPGARLFRPDALNKQSDARDETWWLALPAVYVRGARAATAAACRRVPPSACRARLTRPAAGRVLPQVMLARDARTGAEGLFSADLSPEVARPRFHVLAFESPDDAARLVWLMRALQAAPGGAAGSGSDGLRLGSDTQISMAPMPPQVRAALHEHMPEAVCHRPTLMRRPCLSSAAAR
jgi:hypothetical protein